MRIFTDGFMHALLVLRSYFWQQRLRLLLGLVFVVLSNLFTIYPAVLTRMALDKVLAKAPFSVDLGWGIPVLHFDRVSSMALFFLLCLVAITLVRGIWMFLMRQTLIVMSREIEFAMKRDVYAHLQTLDMSYYRRSRLGDLMARMAEDIAQVRMFTGPAVMYTMNLLVLFGFVLVSMLRVNVWLTALVLVPLPFLSWGVFRISSMVYAKSQALQRALSNLSSTAQEAYAGIRVVQGFGREGLVAGRFQDGTNGYFRQALALGKTDALFQPTVTFLIGLSTVFTIWLGGILAYKGLVSVGNIAEFVLYVNMLIWPFTSVGWVSSLVQKAAASQARIQELMEAKSDLQTGENEVQLNADDPLVAAKEVSLYYPDSNVWALKSISFHWKQGEILGVTGPTGSGKSSLMALLSGWLDPTEGTIAVGRQPLRTIERSSFTKMLAIAPQEIFLFSDTLEANVRFGRANASAHDLAAACDAAGLNSVINELPQGLQTLIGERGLTLSGGQKQRLALARALLAQRPVLLLDDGLSALDTDTEEQVLTNLRAFLKERTALIISHRMATLHLCHRVLVLEGGRLTEQGTPSELIQSNGYFAALHHQQMESRVKE